MNDILLLAVLQSLDAGDVDTARGLADLAGDDAAIETLLSDDVAESVQGPKGPPPFPGAVFDKNKHRWIKPNSLTPHDSTATTQLPAVGERVPPDHHKAIVKKAISKAKAAPKPSPEEVAVAEEKVAELGANKYRRNLVGNTADRAKRRKQLYAEFGDGEKCPCLYCGVVVGEGTLEQDKIVTTAKGGKYRTPNLVPSCSPCNKKRGDMPFDQAMKKVVQRAN